ncbi:MAG TPA: hypothetical protein VN775_01495 [Opitutaceae bacterium]|nr:hypothetical protein [Opitutaceae bacterium]
MTLRSSHKTAIRVIRFTSQVARQCALVDGRMADWAVCETIANGSRRPLGRRGARGATIIRFEKTFSNPSAGTAPPGSRQVTVAVLGELLGRGCTALRLISPAAGRGKIWGDLGFFNRAGSK